LLERGEERLVEGDASLVSEIEVMMNDPGWASERQRRQYEEVRLLTEGDLFAPQRLALIPKYTFSRQSLPKFEVSLAHDIEAGKLAPPEAIREPRGNR